MDEIYKMKLNDVLHTSDYEILRVPGGWVYSRYSETGTDGYSVSACFVPFHNEFLEEK